jgi:hypothetical protein
LVSPSRLSSRIGIDTARILHARPSANREDGQFAAARLQLDPLPVPSPRRDSWHRSEIAFRCLIQFSPRGSPIPRPLSVVPTPVNGVPQWGFPMVIRTHALESPSPFQRWTRFCFTRERSRPDFTPHVTSRV